MRKAFVKPSTNCFPFESEILDETKLGTETEAEKQIKLLLEKQLNTKVTLQECLEQKKQFANSSTFTPLTELIQGKCSLEKYKEVEKREEKLQELQRCGLTKDEISLYLSHSEHSSATSRKRAYTADPSIESEKLEAIEEKIAQHQKQLQAHSTFSGVKLLSRHAMDIEKTLYVGCNRKEKLKNLVTELNDTQLPESDPYYHIKQLSSTLVQKAHKKKLKKDSEQEETIDNEDSKFVYDPSIHHVIVPLEAQEVESHKLSIETIRENPRFKNYEPGTPNKVLYIKNLHSKVNIRDLQSLFDRFVKAGDGCINYRLLSGRMKGQAFITLPDVETAINALQFVNGYMLKGQPVIVQYGKKS